MYNIHEFTRVREMMPGTDLKGNHRVLQAGLKNVNHKRGFRALRSLIEEYQHRVWRVTTAFFKEYLQRVARITSTCSHRCPRFCGCLLRVSDLSVVRF